MIKVSERPPATLEEDNLGQRLIVYTEFTQCFPAVFLFIPENIRCAPCSLPPPRHADRCAAEEASELGNAQYSPSTRVAHFPQGSARARWQLYCLVRAGTNQST